MGQEAKCTVRHRGKVAGGKALLETEELIFRGDLRLEIPYREIASCEAKDGALTVAWPGGTAAFALGPLAAKWAEKIKNPRTLVQKLGVKPGLRAALVGLDDAAFRADLARAGAELVDAAAKDLDLLFLAAETRADLARLEKLKARLRKTGAIWVVRPKGVPGFTDADVMAAARAAGLVDVKVAAFSKTHTAEKLVIPVAKR